MKIGDLAAQAGVTRRQIRYYEDQGLLKPRRDAAGYRIFLESDVPKVARIRALLATGLGTAAIGRILACSEGAPEKIPACGGTLQELSQQRTRLKNQAAGLSHAMARLEDLIAEASA
jgi:DNA-binding transcriptional MerR regulator